MPILLRPLAERSHLPTRLADIGRARQFATIWAGVLGVIAAAVAAVAAVCLLDVAVHLPAFVRAACLVLLMSGGAAGLVGFVWRPIRKPLRAGDVAQLLETRYPKLNDSLASAIEFLNGEGNPNSSARFRRVAVMRAQRAFDKCDPSTLVPSGRAWKAFIAAAVVVGLAGAVGFANPAYAGRAVVRLLDPFGGHSWPKKTDIQIHTPAEFPVRAAIGDPFDLEFRVLGVIPETAVVAIELENGNKADEVIPLPEGDPKRRDVSVRLERHRVPRSFRFQIRANDAVTPWHQVTLAPPPKLVPLDGRQSPQMHLTFPAYTDLPPTDLPDGASVIEAVHGTRIRLTAATDRRVVAATLIPQADRSAAEEATAAAALSSLNGLAAVGSQLLADDVLADIPVDIGGSDGTRLAVEFTPKLSGVYTLELTDETGLVGRRLFDFHLLSDPEPLVVLDRPAVGKDPVLYLPTSSVFVQARAEDRTFAVRNLFLEYRVGGPDAPLRTIPLADLPSFGTPLSGLSGAAIGFTQLKQITVAATLTVPIALFTKPNGQPPGDGDRITIRAAAYDHDDVSVLKEPGRSKEEVTLVVVAQPALDTILQQEASKLRPQLLKVREQQRRVREKTDDLAKAADDRPLTLEQSAQLGQIERDQRAIRNELTDPRDGLQQAAQLLTETIRTNQLPRTPTTDRVDALAQDLGRLADEALDRVEPLISSAKQESENAAAGGATDPKRAAEDLKRAVRRQQAAEGLLDAMLKQLEQWAGAGEVRAEARAIKDLLNRAGEQAGQAAESVEPGKPADRLNPREKAELARAADKFNQLADRAGSTLSKAQRLADEKSSRGDELGAKADEKAAEADAAEKAAGELPTGSDAAREAKNAADKQRAEANALRTEAEKAKAEAAALRSAVQNAGGQEVVNDLRSAAAELQQNNSSASSDAQRSAAQRLDQFAQSLAEQQPEVGDLLRKKKELADEVDQIAEEQVELQKKAKQAAQIEDPMKRDEELAKLAREQERLKEKTEQAAERLTREREFDAAQKLREAAEQMDAARGELEQGKTPDVEQNEALERLDESVNQLDQERQNEQDKLGREKRAQLADQLKSLRDRLQATDDEAGRIQAEVVRQAGWDRTRLASLGDLEDRAKGVAADIRQLAEKELEPLPVFRQLTEQAAALTDASAERFAERKLDALDNAGGPFDADVEVAADDRTRRPLRTALRWIDHVLNSLKDDPKAENPQAGNTGGGEMPPGGGGGGGAAGAQDQNTGVPQLAQLKALRAIQAELNERTRTFAQNHPNVDKLSDADREELAELEQSQREVADLFEKIKPAFEKLAEEQLDL